MNSNLPSSELSEERLLREAQVLIGTGTITTAGTMGFICYYIMANPAIRERLAAELADVMEGYPEKKPSWAELEKVEYLQAIIKEGLRYASLYPCNVGITVQLTFNYANSLSYGTMHRRPRVSPKEPLVFKEWVIPPGIPVGMSAYFQHRDPVIFPKPMEFIPERWLKDVTPEMQHNFIPFSRGSRYCLGMK